MFKKLFRRITLVLMVAFVFFANSQQTILAEDSLPDFDVLSLELVEMDNLFQVGTDQQTIIFDSESAQRKGFSPEGIKLAEEMAAFTNKIVNKAVKSAKRHGVKDVELINIKEARIDINKYPSLAVYFKEAAARHANGLIDGDVILNLNATDDPKTVCGSIDNPVPSSAAPYIKQGPFDTATAAEKELKSRGYYKADTFANGYGWTRNQTYNEPICKKNNYRDHAGKPEYSKGDNKWYFAEQDYTGSIPGEPNPATSRKATNWPYLTWPAYVYWWHKTF